MWLCNGTLQCPRGKVAHDVLFCGSLLATTAFIASALL